MQGDLFKMGIKAGLYKIEGPSQKLTLTPVL